mmetsp:Transcript_5911/g.12401  ORF Transcript_5911/g.12401 Transcript_5911/m.12401 type:complete len:293 (-) Transcript_5911:123-1001(-)
MGKAKNAKAVERKRKKLLALQAAKRVEESIAKANAVDDPLAGLEPFLAFDVAPKPAKTGAPAADRVELPSPSSCADVSADLTGVGNDTESAKRSMPVGIPAKVTFHPSPLPTDLHDACLHLFESNMADMYRDSSWGLDLEEKSNELRHETARFLIVEACSSSSDSTSTSGGDTVNEETGGDSRRDILAFSHFRFEPNDEDKPTEEVLYVYEVQVSDAAQRSGLGKRLMNVMELVALRQGMKKVMLTVFKNNQRAMAFYLEKMKYVIDETSPSNFDGEEADYEILSKTIGTRA